MKKVKICFAASSGGHYEQLLRLSPLFERYPSFIITESTEYSVDIPGVRQYYLKQINRKEKGRLRGMLINAVKSFFIYCRERPDLVITTGVLSTIPICLTAKIFRKKLIYIESFAKVESPTETGRFLYRFADRFYVQWEPMLAIYPGAVYIGGIY